MAYSPGTSRGSGFTPSAAHNLNTNPSTGAVLAELGAGLVGASLAAAGWTASQVARAAFGAPSAVSNAVLSLGRATMIG